MKGEGRKCIGLHIMELNRRRARLSFHIPFSFPQAYILRKCWFGSTVIGNDFREVCSRIHWRVNIESVASLNPLTVIPAVSASYWISVSSLNADVNTRFRSAEINTEHWPCQGSEGCSTACDRGGPGSRPGLSVWNPWWQSSIGTEPSPSSSVSPR